MNTNYEREYSIPLELREMYLEVSKAFEKRVYCAFNAKKAAGSNTQRVKIIKKEGERDESKI